MAQNRFQQSYFQNPYKYGFCKCIIWISKRIIRILKGAAETWVLGTVYTKSISHVEICALYDDIVCRHVRSRAKLEIEIRIRFRILGAPISNFPRIFWEVRNCALPVKLIRKQKSTFKIASVKLNSPRGAHPVNLARRQLVVHLEGLAAQGGNNTMNVDRITCVVLIAEDDHHKRRHHSVSCFRRTRPSRARV